MRAAPKVQRAVVQGSVVVVVVGCVGVVVVVVEIRVRAVVVVVGLAGQMFNVALVVIVVEVADGAGAEDVQDALGFGSEVRRPRGEWRLGANVRAARPFACQQALIGQ